MSRIKNSIAAALAVSVIMLCMLFVPGCSGEDDSYSSGAEVTVVINEAMSSNSAFAPAGDGKYYDWVELHNIGAQSVDLSGCYLTDDESTPRKFKLTGLVIEPDGYAVVYLSGLDGAEENGTLHAGFKLSSAGETLLLSDKDGYVISQLSIPASEENVSFGIDQDSDSGELVWFAAPTPGGRNAGSRAQSSDQLEYISNGVIINEYMNNNSFINYDEDGDYSDWVELYNASGEAADMGGYSLTDNPDDPGKWKFPQGTVIAPNGYLLVYCSGKDKTDPAANLHTGFRLSKEDTYLGLYTNQGKLCHSLTVQPLQTNISCGYPAGQSELKLFARPTPGAPNTTSSFELSAVVAADYNDGVLISETLAVSSAADKYADDYIEIYNSTSGNISLEGYTLRQSKETPFFTFPAVTIAAGDYLLVYCTGEENTDTSARLTAATKLSHGGETLYLADETGKICDYFETGKQLYGITSGRAGSDISKRLFFAEPTPGKANSSSTYLGYAGQPSMSACGGYVDAGTAITINVPEGTYVTYTLDGAEPSGSSRKYTEGQELVINKTTVVRAVAWRDGYISSQPVTETYFVTDKHSLPIVSLSSAPAGLFSQGSGILVDGYGWTPERPHYGANYWWNVERNSHIEYYDGSGIKAVEFEAGIKAFGQYARGEPQKGIRLMLREKYGENEVTYPFFEHSGMTTFGSLLLRPSGQDWNRAKVRDELVPNIVAGQMDIDYMDASACALYINGDYWGLYYIREKLNADYLVNKYGFKKGDFDLIKSQLIAQDGTIKAWNDLNKFCIKNDLSIQKNYDYVCSQVDIDSLINFWIIETFFANPDTGNIRCYRTYDGGKWRWMIYDFDWAMSGSTWKLNYIDRHMLDRAGHGATNNMSNALIRKLLANEDFKDKFISAYCLHLNTTFNPDRTIPIFEGMVEKIRDEIPRQCERWGFPTDALWEKNLTLIRTFLEEKPALAVKQIQSSFRLSDSEIQKYMSENK